MRQIAFVLLLLVVNFSAFTQQKIIFAEGTYPQAFLTHKVEPKQNFYSVGRMYNVAPAEIASFNQLPIEKGLTLGKLIRIPLTENNFLHHKSADTSEALIRVYYIIKGRETLDQVAKRFHVKPEDFKKNNPTAKTVSNGTKVLLGYLKVSKHLSPLAGGGLTIPVSTEHTTVQPVQNNSNPNTDTTTLSVPPVKLTTVTNNTSPQNFNGGAFKSIYAAQSQAASEVAETGTAAIFKSTSGWKDGKYYCFYNNAPQGSIIMITNSANGKVVYAKVLDALPDMRQQNQLIIQLSNAAANELGAIDAGFACTVTVHK
ncbi:hypothetical protein BH09BAC2_BH09BAC2_14210 [soil metagenome]